MNKVIGYLHIDAELRSRLSPQTWVDLIPESIIQFSSFSQCPTATMWITVTRFRIKTLGHSIVLLSSNLQSHRCKSKLFSATKINQKERETKTMTDKRNLLLLFDRPNEPVFMVKGSQKAVFDVPSKFLSERYRPVGQEVTSRFGENERIRVRDISIPNLRVPMSIARDEPFSLFVPRHRTAAAHLINIFMSKRNPLRYIRPKFRTVLIKNNFRFAKR